MARRKPVPRTGTPNEGEYAAGSARESQSQLVDPSIKRYSLVDRPMLYHSEGQDGKLPPPDHDYFDDDTSSRAHTDTQEDMSVSVPPLASSLTMQQATSPVAEHQLQYRQQQPERGYKPYQPGQFLAPIITGETLKLDDILPEEQQTPVQSRPDSDPFNELQAGIIRVSQMQLEMAATTRPDQSQGAFQAYEHDEQQLLRPMQAQEQSLQSGPPSDYHGSQADTEYYSQHTPSDYHPSLHSHSSYTPLVTTEPALVVGTGIDHFQHDAEAAYASGSVYSSSPYRIPRSRSPTPLVDEEDYYIVDNEGIHYIGGDANGYSRESFQDPEKAMLGLGGEYAGYEAQYLGSGHDRNVVYDPDPPTPTSQQHSLPETLLETRHFGPAPSGRIIRRHKTKKRVPLTNGNLVVNLDVPPRLVLPRKGQPEMMQTRYTAVTCDPDEFERCGFVLRQNESGRKTELLIIITMYNEDEVLFCRTLYGVMRNISHLCTRKNSQTWGPNAWEKVVVCVIADGRKKVHPRVLDCLTLLGVYQAGGHMKNRVNDKEVTAHVFEYTTSFALDPNLHFKFPDKGIVPTQIIFCMKEKNQKKINSHRWGFNAFGAMLQPNVCVLLDVGTRPGSNSIYRLWKAFDINSNVGGACGEISVYKGKNWSALLNPLVAAQNFEYKVSCILDKPTESMFGYISVLPGAFSAYRYIALQNNERGQGPLASYFKGEVLHGRDTDIFTSNMYLAEDRILCFELIAKRNCNWVLKYVKGAFGETDVPDALPEFISQRRRWLNGSFFAATYAIAHVGQVLRSGHSMTRKILLMVETVYNIINLVFAWFSIGNFYLFFVVLTSSLEDPSLGLSGIKYFNTLMQYVMASMIVSSFIFSMGNRPAASKWKYKTTAIVLAFLMLYMLIASVVCSLEAAKQGGAANSVMLLSVLVTYGLYALSSILAFDPWHMLTSFIPYIFLSPTYINILNVYAFSNLDDISWGTKQDATPDTDLGAVTQDIHSQVDVELFSDKADVNSLYEEALENLRDKKPISGAGRHRMRTVAEKDQVAKDYYASVRTNVLLAWVLSNGLLLLAILGGVSSVNAFDRDIGINRTKGYLMFILAFTAIANCVRFAGSTLYLLARLITG